MAGSRVIAAFVIEMPGPVRACGDRLTPRPGSCVTPAMARSRAMRSSVDGWLANKPLNAAMQRIDDEHMRRGRIGVGLRIVGALRRRINRRQRIGQPQRPSGQFRAGLVGFEFARPADGRLHQQGGEGRQHGHQQDADQPQRIAPPAHEESEIRQHADGAGDHRHHGHGEGVAILHMPQLMGDHARQFLAIDLGEQARW